MSYSDECYKSAGRRVLWRRGLRPMRRRLRRSQARQRDPVSCRHRYPKLSLETLPAGGSAFQGAPAKGVRDLSHNPG